MTSALGMRLGTVAALLAVTAAAIWFGYFAERERGAEKQQADALERRLFRKFELADVKTVALKARSDEVALEAVAPPGGDAADGRWRITAPRALEADAAAVGAIVRQLQGLERTEVVEDDPKDLAKYGLAEPGEKVTLRFADGAEETLLVGKEFRFSNGRYVKRADREQVLLVPASLHAALDKDLLALRAKDLVPIDGETVQRITVKLQAPAENFGYMLGRTEGAWRVLTPRDLAADDAKAGSILSTLEALRAWSFAAEDPSAAELEQYGLAHPAAIIELTAPSGPVVVRIGRKDGKHYARVDGHPAVALVGSGILTTVDVSLFQLRDKRALVFDRDRVAGVKIQHRGGDTVVLKKRSLPDGGDRWELLLPEPAAAALGEVDTLLWKLAELRAERFVDEEAAPAAVAAAGLSDPRITVTLLDAEDAELGALLAGNRGEGETQVMAKGIARIDAVKNDDLDAVPLLAKDLREVSAPAEAPPPAP